jgi:hypothetical protein
MRFLKPRDTTPPLVSPPAETIDLPPAPTAARAPLPWTDASWLAWQTLTYSGSAQIKTAGVKHHEAELRAVAARHGPLVMAELRIEEEGQYAGAVRVYVGGVQLGSIPHGLAQEFRDVTARLAAAGTPTLCRALLDAEPGGYVDVWLCGKARERQADDPFLPPTLGERLTLTADVIAYLDDVVLGTRAKSKRVVSNGELVQRAGGWRVVLDGHDLGSLPGARYLRLDEAQAAGFPVTCQVRILRQPDRPVRVEADFPTS